ncbi:MAG: hypothetical protein RPT95_03700, partial [Candidatus Sedimenticola sp. (ex Thyasira tokunagai)]
RDDLTSRSYAIFGFPLALCARRASSIASRLPGTNRLGFQPSLAVSEGMHWKTFDRLRKEEQAADNAASLEIAQKMGIYEQLGWL